MTLLLIYVFIALGFSFLCSVAEAVLLSVTSPYVALMVKEGKPSGKLLEHFKQDINRPLAAILTLNTIAHTLGAAGAGAQAALVFGNAYVGIASAVLTLLILVLSEIIPKTLGAKYWRQLAPLTAYSLKYLILVLYPFVLLSEKLTAGLSHGPSLRGFNREEFAAMAEMGEKEGQLASQETRIIKNLFTMHHTPVEGVMTPRTVMFSLPEDMTVDAFFAQHASERFSRIPIYARDKDRINGFVLRVDLLLAKARGNGANALSIYRRPLPTISAATTVLKAFKAFLDQRAHIMLVVDPFGGTDGIVTLEDIQETLLGLEIVDEGDREVDMQVLARKLWRRRAEEMGIDLNRLADETDDRSANDGQETGRDAGYP
ncbi:MAG: HlyC/CorC family transporter [Chromatiales bacterium]|nr:HlyC/CorC family transporter [Chromatiales bacterium]